MERKLAAILAADIAGYSRLMGEDEQETLAALRSHRAVVDPIVEAHRGRIFNSAGDSIIAEFPSAVEAVQCALEIQYRIRASNEPLTKNRRLEFRIGINLGDVVLDGGNLFGDGVNIADRVQKLAEPGEICVSRNVYDQIRSNPTFKPEPMGEFRVKNIALPVGVYRIPSAQSSRRPQLLRLVSRLYHPRRRVIVAGLLALVCLLAIAAWQWQWAASKARSGFPSMAVLNLQNLSSSQSLDTFGQGLTEDLTTGLSRFPDLTVVSRTTTLADAGQGLASADIGRKLGVDYVLEGSVQKEGDTLRVNVQLIDARSDVHVWAAGYEGADTGSLQKDIVTRVLASVASSDGEIRKNEYKRLEGKSVADYDDYDYFLSGHEILSRFSSLEEHDRAGAIWQDGLAKFPNSDLLRVSLALYYFLRPWDFDTQSAEVDFRKAAELARTTLAGQHLSPFVRWRGLSVMSYIHWFAGDFESAVLDAETAANLAPYDADTLSFLSRVQIASGNFERGLEWVQESRVLDPTIPRNTRILAWVYYLTGNFQKSIDAAAEHQKLSRRFSGDAGGYMAASYWRLGRPVEAREAIRKGLTSDPNWSLLRERAERLQRPYKDPAISEQEIRDLADAGLPELPSIPGWEQSAEQLTGSEIRGLIFGHTLDLLDLKSGALSKQTVFEDGTTNWSDGTSQDTASLLAVGSTFICYRWRDGGPSCAAVVRRRAGLDGSGEKYAIVEPNFSASFTIAK